MITVQPLREVVAQLWPVIIAPLWRLIRVQLNRMITVQFRRMITVRLLRMIAVQLKIYDQKLTLRDFYTQATLLILKGKTTMKNQYFTKTGIELKVINGLKGLEVDDYTLHLDFLFQRTDIWVNTQSYLGGSDQLQLILNIVIDAEQWPKTRQKRHKALSQLTLDCGNYLSRFFGLKSYTVPTVESEKRISKGCKTLRYTYNISKEYAASLGIDVTQWRPCGMVKIRGESVLKNLKKNLNSRQA